MQRVRICDDVNQCRFLWQETFDNDRLFHAWEIRECFHDAFNRTPCFIVCEDAHGLSGLLPLSEIEETGTLAFFPGETWRHKTWLEQNRVVARSPGVFRALLEAVPGDTHIRYLEPSCVPPSCGQMSLDETGYLFFPRQYAFSFQNYRSVFSRKSLKRLDRELDVLRDRGVTFRHDCRDDVQQLFRMNLEAFGGDSYFDDARFLQGFERMIAYLDRRGGLRVTTTLVAGRVAAVDVGAVWQNDYTVLAGGTSRDFPGVAKLINFHHLEIACRERFDSVDFLCGSFGWKQRFHLTPRDLVQISLATGASALFADEYPLPIAAHAQ